MLYPRWLILHLNFFWKMLINNYKHTMVAQHLVLQGAKNSQQSKRRSDKAVNSLQANKERIFHVHMLVESLCIAIQKYVLWQCSGLKLVLNFFLMFHQTSGLCSYKIFLIKRVYSKVQYGKCVLIYMACLFRSTIGEIVKLINIYNEEWLALLGKIHCFTRRQDFATFLQYVHYITIWPSFHKFLWFVSLGTP